MYVEYRSNNSGGGWWLSDAHWKALEAAGWKIAWASLDNLYEKGGYVLDDDGMPKLVPAGRERQKKGEVRFMGALATRAYRAGLSLRDAAAEWERITGQDSTDGGCPCCGQPHNFAEYDDAGKYVASGPTVSYEARW